MLRATYSLNGCSSTKGASKMRVFCPEHKKGFFTPRQSPIKCENRGHILGELDFHGEGRTSNQIQWQYCCNCEHLCPIDLERKVLETCPVCTRRPSLIYLCDQCFTITFESDTPLPTKNFTLTSAGAPEPSCPGCLKAASADLREHDCDEVESRFITALQSCPICLERLDVPPAFPSSVAQYLKKTKSAEKLNATFDYEGELFFPIEDGEFVLIRHGSDNTAIVLPRSARFSSAREFFELYQDYYHCRNVNAGEVHIIEPALAARVDHGWRPESMGILEVVADDAKPSIARTQSTEPNFVRRTALSTAKIDVAPCMNCVSVVETRYAFCWNCGESTARNSDASKQYNSAMMASDPAHAVEDESTVKLDASSPKTPVFSWASSKSSGTVVTTLGLRAITMVVIVLLLLPLAWYLLTPSPSKKDVTAQTEPSKLTSPEAVASTAHVTDHVTAQIKDVENPASHSAEEELAKLREKRISASAFDSLTILQAIARSEKQYPDDYRFPYERAKMAIARPTTKSHEDAFRALALAAAKAIKADRAQEMLRGLKADKAGDFHKLAHGHREWIQVIEALQMRDARLLQASKGKDSNLLTGTAGF